MEEFVMSTNNGKRSTFRMADEQTTQFVRLYREHENLWNIYLPEYRNRDARSASLQALVHEMKIDNFQIKDVAKKVKSLRCTYYLELAKIERSKCSSNVTGFVYKPSLPWFKDMDYIIKMINTNENEAVDNLKFEASENQEDVQEEDDQSVFIQPSSPVQSSSLKQGNYNQKTAKRFKKKKEAGPIAKAIKELKDLNKMLNASHFKPPSNTYQDECEVMGKQIAAQLRALPEIIRLGANLDIQRILHEYRVQHLNSISSQTVELSPTSSSGYAS